VNTAINVPLGSACGNRSAVRAALRARIWTPAKGAKPQCGNLTLDHRNQQRNPDLSLRRSHTVRHPVPLVPSDSLVPRVAPT
jgi:hypothetical protein